MVPLHKQSDMRSTSGHGVDRAEFYDLISFVIRPKEQMYRRLSDSGLLTFIDSFS